MVSIETMFKSDCLLVHGNIYIRLPVPDYLCTVPSFRVTVWNYIKPLHPKITMYILHTVLKTFPEVLIKRNCFAINSLFS